MLESVKIQKFGQKYYENYHIFDYLILSKLSSISISIMMIHFYPHFPLLSQLSTNYLDYLLLLQTERLYRVYILHLFSSGNIGSSWYSTGKHRSRESKHLYQFQFQFQKQCSGKLDYLLYTVPMLDFEPEFNRRLWTLRKHTPPPLLLAGVVEFQ